MKVLKVYDIECLKNLFTISFVSIDSDLITSFCLSPIYDDWKEQLELLIEFLNNNVSGLVGYNNLEYDYPLLHYIILNYSDFIELNDITKVLDLIYSKSQSIIDAEYSEISEKDVIIPQLDIYKIWHYDNKKVGLKTLQISMNWHNVEDMPFKHYESIINSNDITKILKYNINDILSTKEFYLKTKDKIELRKKILDTYGIKCMNYSDSKIGEKLTLKLYCDATNKNPKKVNYLRSPREFVDLNDCIFDYISYNSKEFNKILKFLKTQTVTETKNFFSKIPIERVKNILDIISPASLIKSKGQVIVDTLNVYYKGFRYDFGTGGIHGCIKSGIYESDENYLIIDADVGSLYPNLAIVNNLYPEHLGEEFPIVYNENIVLPRLAAKKSGDKVLSDGFKLAANSVYGKSGSEHSFLNDIKYLMSTTINGQLLLCNLAERLVDNIPDCTMIQINTDGLTVKIHKDYEDLYYKICKEWEQYTNLGLEWVEYSKMIIRDVNNYCSQSTNEVYFNGSERLKKPKNDKKYKGVFEIDKVIGSEPAYHKDNSFKIVPIALSKFFFEGIPVDQTIYNHQNIYDFCGRYKASRDWGSEIHYINNGNPVHEILQKNNRYFVSLNGVKYFKFNEVDGRKEEIQRGYYVTIFNKYFEKNIKEYNINYSFYITQCNKEINKIINKQLLLF